MLIENCIFLPMTAVFLCLTSLFVCFSPSSLLAIEEEGYARVYLLLSLTAHVSLFPLLHRPAGTSHHQCSFRYCQLRCVLAFRVVVLNRGVRQLMTYYKASCVQKLQFLTAEIDEHSFRC